MGQWGGPGLGQSWATLAAGRLSAVELAGGGSTWVLILCQVLWAHSHRGLSLRFSQEQAPVCKGLVSSVNVCWPKEVTWPPRTQRWGSVFYLLMRGPPTQHHLSVAWMLGGQAPLWPCLQPTMVGKWFFFPKIDQTQERVGTQPFVNICSVVDTLPGTKWHIFIWFSPSWHYQCCNKKTEVRLHLALQYTINTEPRNDLHIGPPDLKCQAFLTLNTMLSYQKKKKDNLYWECPTGPKL